MQNFQDNFETHKRSFISAFSFCMTVPLKALVILQIVEQLMYIKFLIDVSSSALLAVNQGHTKNLRSS